MNTLTVAFAACLGLGLATQAYAHASEHRSEVLLILRLIDQIPTRVDLDRSGVRPPELLAVAEDKALHRYVRARAAGMLGHFDEPGVRAAVRRLVTSSKDVEVRLQALVALTHLEGVASQTLLTELLEHPHPELRAAAFRGLVRIAAPNLSELIAHRLDVEAIPWVRSTLVRAVDLSGRTAPSEEKAPKRRPERPTP